jgi:hypothetical protein
MYIKYIILTVGIFSSIFLGISLEHSFFDTGLEEFNPEDYEIPDSTIDVIISEPSEDGTVSELSEESTVTQDQIITVREIEYKDVSSQTDIKSSDIQSYEEQLDDEISFIQELQEDPDLYGISEDSPIHESTLTRHYSPDDRMDIANIERANKFDRSYIRK